jgi:hypothetical protein
MGNIEFFQTNKRSKGRMSIIPLVVPLDSRSAKQGRDGSKNEREFTRYKDRLCSINCLLSVDDIMLFLDGSKSEAIKTQEILNTFCVVNAQKSTYIWIQWLGARSFSPLDKV